MLQILSNYHNVIISCYHDVLITGTKIKPVGTLITPSDTVIDALFNYGYHPNRPLLKTDVSQICSCLEPQAVPRHDL